MLLYQAVIIFPFLPQCTHVSLQVIASAPCTCVCLVLCVVCVWCGVGVWSCRVVQVAPPPLLLLCYTEQKGSSDDHLVIDNVSTTRQQLSLLVKTRGQKRGTCCIAAAWGYFLISLLISHTLASVVRKREIETDREGSQVLIEMGVVTGGGPHTTLHTS